MSINAYGDKLPAMFESHKRNSKKQFYVSLSLAQNVTHSKCTKTPFPLLVSNICKKPFLGSSNETGATVIQSS